MGHTAARDKALKDEAKKLGGLDAVLVRQARDEPRDGCAEPELRDEPRDEPRRAGAARRAAR